MRRKRLTPLQETEARRAAAAEAKKNKKVSKFSDKDKATRNERVAKVKDAIERSGEIKGDHVAPARAALRAYLRDLNDAKQPDDARFETLIEAPFKAPPKKKQEQRY